MIKLEEVLNATEAYWLNQFEEKVSEIIKDEEAKFSGNDSIIKVLNLLIEKNKNTFIRTFKQSEAYKEIINEEKKRVKATYEMFVDFNNSFDDPFFAVKIDEKTYTRSMFGNSMLSMCMSLKSNDLKDFFTHYQKQEFLLPIFMEDFKIYSDKYQYFQPSKDLPNGKHCLESLDVWCEYITTKKPIEYQDKIDNFFHNNQDLNKTFRKGVLSKFEHLIKDLIEGGKVRYENSLEFQYLSHKDTMTNFINKTNESQKREFFSSEKNNKNTFAINAMNLFDVLLKGINLVLYKYDNKNQNDFKDNYLELLEVAGKKLVLKDYLSIIIASSKFLRKRNEIGDYVYVIQKKDYFFERLINETHNLNLLPPRNVAGALKEHTPFLQELHNSFEKYKEDKKRVYLINNYLRNESILDSNDTDVKTITVNEYNFCELLGAFRKQEILNTNTRTSKILDNAHEHIDRIYNQQIKGLFFHSVTRGGSHNQDDLGSELDDDYDYDEEKNEAHKIDYKNIKLSITLHYPGCSSLTKNEIVTVLAKSFAKIPKRDRDFENIFSETIQQGIREINLSKKLDNETVKTKNTRYKI